MLERAIFSISSEENFLQTALEVFRFQYRNNPIYQQFCNLIRVKPEQVTQLHQIPFLPIEFFKSHQVITQNLKEEIIFTSSGTTGTKPSKHYVAKLSLYEKSFQQCFQQFYGAVEEYVILALLPAYLERKGSSLIFMVNDFINQSKHPESGFYLNNLDELAEQLKKLEKEGKKILLIGVSFALLDLVEKHQFHLKNTIIMETGGMKGRRKEMIREELHHHLKKGFGVNKIHSEYGMTELLSQAYSLGNGIFECPNHMKILIRDPEDALEIYSTQKNGAINVIDLANLYSCSFIATQDLGRNKSQNSFEILGRFDTSDLRGCNLIVF